MDAHNNLLQLMMNSVLWETVGFTGNGHHTFDRQEIRKNEYLYYIDGEIACGLKSHKETNQIIFYEYPKRNSNDLTSRVPSTH